METSNSFCLTLSEVWKSVWARITLYKFSKMGIKKIKNKRIFFHLFSKLMYVHVILLFIMLKLLKPIFSFASNKAHRCTNVVINPDLFINIYKPFHHHYCAIVGNLWSLNSDHWRRDCRFFRVKFTGQKCHYFTDSQNPKHSCSHYEEIKEKVNQIVSLLSHNLFVMHCKKIVNN